MLKSMLLQRRKDTLQQIAAAERAGDGVKVSALTNDLIEIDTSIDGLAVKAQQGSSNASGDNPVSMTATLRREMGANAADFLDDYAKSIHQMVMRFITHLKNKSLDLGKDDPNDGETSLREEIQAELGRRGLAAIEPHFEEWRRALFRCIAKELRDSFEEPKKVVVLRDKDVGDLLGVQYMDADEADEAEAAEEVEEGEEEGSDEEKPETAEGDPEDDSEDDMDLASESDADDDEDEDEGEDEDEDDEKPSLSVNASLLDLDEGPLQFARGPVSGHAVASDFRPSSYRSPNLV